MLLHHRTARLTAVGVLVLSAPLLAACTSAATDEIYTPARGVNERAARVDVLNAVIVATRPDAGTFIATFANNEVGEVDGGTISDATDTLESITVDGTPVRLSGRPVDVPGGGTAVLGASTNDVVADFPGIKVTGDFEPGDFVTVSVTFREAGQITLEVPVVPNEGDFEGQDGLLAPSETESEHHDDTTGEGSESPAATETEAESH